MIDVTSSIKTDLEQGVSLVPEEAVRAFGPASLSNLGPGFDTLGLCLEGIGDVVEAWRIENPGVSIQIAGDYRISLVAENNTAGVAALQVMARHEMAGGVAIRIHKGFTPGSGIGSSAASAVAAAVAVNALAEKPLAKEDLVEAVIAGEAVASGARHGDNVLPALFGGLVLVSSEDPTTYRRVPLHEGLWISVILPEIEVLTRHARALLPREVGLKTAVYQASALAFMIDAFRSGDWQDVGRWMMKDVLAEPVRSTLVPCYHHVKTAAVEAGALGCALTGSGPAMFAVTSEPACAREVLDAMRAACLQEGIASTGFLSQPNLSGASLVGPANDSL